MIQAAKMHRCAQTKESEPMKPAMLSDRRSAGVRQARNSSSCFAMSSIWDWMWFIGRQ